MNSALQQYYDRLAQTATDLFDEIDLASQEGGPIEDIEGAKAQAADLIGQYDRLVAGLGKEDRAEFEAGMGLVVSRIKEKLTHLKEAPE